MKTLINTNIKDEILIADKLCTEHKIDYLEFGCKYLNQTKDVKMPISEQFRVSRKSSACLETLFQTQMSLVDLRKLNDIL